MTGSGRGDDQREAPRRGPKDRPSGHELARKLAAERVDGPLDPDAAAWLDDHLEGCQSCARIAATYQADHAELRGWRDLPSPEPPRDLWARTSAAIDSQGRSPGHRGTRPGVPWLRRVRASSRPLATLVGIMAVVVLAVASLQNFPATPRTALASPPASSASIAANPGSTPLAVHRSQVAWVSQRDPETYTYNVTTVDHVCASDKQPDCAPLEASPGTGVRIPVQPGAIVVSPTSKSQAVVVGKSGGPGAGSVYAIDVPAPTASTAPTPAAPPSSGPASSAPASSPAQASSSPTGPTATPSASQPAQTAPGASTPPPSAPASPGESAPVSLPPSPGTTPTSTPGVAARPIISGVVLVGQSASYSSDGQWFAFTARPSDASHGPDVYVWHVGDALAVPMTADHASVFSSWLGNELLGSRPAAVADVTRGRGNPASGSPASGSPASDSPLGASPTTNGAGAGRRAEAVSFLMDPSSGIETPLPGRTWRPVVDASGRYVVYWTGTLRLDEVTGVWMPDQGRLVLSSWPALRGTANGSPDAQDLPASAGGLGEGPSVSDWDVRWDPSGSHLAAWVADSVDATVGRLSLLSLDAASGRLESEPLLAPTPALPGFALADGQLAWATPPGQNGQGSSLDVLAWSGADRGRIETTPLDGSQPVVVIR